MSETIAKITLDRKPRTPSAEQLQMLDAALAQQALRVNQFVSQMRVYSAEVSAGQTVTREQVDALLEPLLDEYLGEYWRDYDLGYDLAQLLELMEPGDESLDEQALHNELRKIFWVLDLPVNDGPEAWRRIRAFVVSFVDYNQDDMMEVVPGKVVFAVSLNEDSGSLAMGEQAKQVLRLAALPKKVRALIGLYRDDELAASGSGVFEALSVSGSSWGW